MESTNEIWANRQFRTTGFRCDQAEGIPIKEANTHQPKLANSVTLSTFVALSVNSAKGLARRAARCFAEFTLSAANVLNMTALYLPATLQLRLMRIGIPPKGELASHILYVLPL